MVQSYTEYSDEEQQRILQYVLELKKTLLARFFDEHDLPHTGTKEVMRERVQTALKQGVIGYTDLVDLLDSVAPWGKQHVYLFDGPDTQDIRLFRSKDTFRPHLRRLRLGRYIDRATPLILPKTTTLSSIMHSGEVISVMAVERREGWERREDLDKKERTDDGEDIRFDAHIREVTRGIVRFEWDVQANNAFLQITQLPSKFKYEDAQERFYKLVEKWLPIRSFRKCTIFGAIKHLHEETERLRQGEIRSVGVKYKTLSGRQLWGKSASPQDHLPGDPVIDAAMRDVRKDGAAQEGNFYFRLNVEPATTEEVHVILNGRNDDIQFPTPNSEEALRHVLRRVRALG